MHTLQMMASYMPTYTSYLMFVLTAFIQVLLDLPMKIIFKCRDIMKMSVHKLTNSSHKPSGQRAGGASLLLMAYMPPAPSHLELDPERWQTLPHDILEMVVGKLPVVAKLRWGVVSRKWQAILREVRTYIVPGEVSQTRCMAIYSEYGAIQPGNNLPKDISCFQVGLSFLPTGFQPVRASGPFILFESLVNHELVGIMRGIQRRLDVQGLSFVVANVITQTCHRLPLLLLAAETQPSCIDFQYCEADGSYFVDAEFAGRRVRVFANGVRDWDGEQMEEVASGSGQVQPVGMVAQLGGYSCTSVTPNAYSKAKCVKAACLKNGSTVDWSFYNTQGWGNCERLRLLSFNPCLSASPKPKEKGQNQAAF